MGVCARQWGAREEGRLLCVSNWKHTDVTNTRGQTSDPWVSVSAPDLGSRGPKQRWQLSGGCPPGGGGRLGRERESSRGKRMQEGWGVQRRWGRRGAPARLGRTPAGGFSLLATAPLSQRPLREATITAPVRDGPQSRAAVPASHAPIHRADPDLRPASVWEDPAPGSSWHGPSTLQPEKPELRPPAQGRALTPQLRQALGVQTNLPGLWNGPFPCKTESWDSGGPFCTVTTVSPSPSPCDLFPSHQGTPSRGPRSPTDLGPVSRGSTLWWGGEDATDGRAAGSGKDRARLGARAGFCALLSPHKYSSSARRTPPGCPAGSASPAQTLQEAWPFVLTLRPPGKPAQEGNVSQTSRAQGRSVLRFLSEPRHTSFLAGSPR